MPFSGWRARRARAGQRPLAGRRPQALAIVLVADHRGGIGDLSAELILIRGAGEPDLAPRHEPRLPRAIQLAYQLDAGPTAEQMETITDGWAPYRSWVAVLLRTYLRTPPTRSAGGG